MPDLGEGGGRGCISRPPRGQTRAASHSKPLAYRRGTQTKIIRMNDVAALLASPVLVAHDNTSTAQPDRIASVSARTIASPALSGISRAARVHTETCASLRRWTSSTRRIRSSSCDSEPAAQPLSQLTAATRSRAPTTTSSTHISVQSSHEREPRPPMPLALLAC